MAKVKAAGELSPFAFSVGNRITWQDLKAAIEALNYAYAEQPEIYANLVSGRDEDLSTFSVDTHAVEFQNTSTSLYVFQIWIDPDILTIRLRAEMDLDNPSNSDLTINIGAHSEVMSFLAPGVVEIVRDVAVTSIGTGWQRVELIGERLNGAADNILTRWSIESLPIPAASIPDPPNE